MRTPTHLMTIGILLAIGISASPPLHGQDTGERRGLYDASGRLVYVSYLKVPWARVDSLIQLESVYNAVTEKGIELGCYDDREFLIHQTGSEYNVVYKTYYKKWSWPFANDGCGARAYRAAVPDSVQRAAINAGNQWVFGGDMEHRDEIYWEPYPGN